MRPERRLYASRELLAACASSRSHVRSSEGARRERNSASAEGAPLGRWGASPKFDAGRRPTSAGGWGTSPNFSPRLEHPPHWKFRDGPPRCANRASRWIRRRSPEWGLPHEGRQVRERAWVLSSSLVASRRLACSSRVAACGETDAGSVGETPADDAGTGKGKTSSSSGSSGTADDDDDDATTSPGKKDAGASGPTLKSDTLVQGDVIFEGIVGDDAVYLELTQTGANLMAVPLAGGTPTKIRGDWRRRRIPPQRRRGRRVDGHRQ